MKGFSQFGLAQLATTLGLQMPEKTSLDHYKTSMDKALLEEPELFVRYGIQDAEILFPIFENMIQYTNSILTNSFKMPYNLLFNRYTMCYSTGRLVSEIFERYIYFYFCGKPSTSKDYFSKELKVKAAFAKLSILRMGSKKYDEQVENWNELFSHTNWSDLKTYIKTNKLEKTPLLQSPFYAFKPFSYASITWFLTQDTKSFSNYNALVSDGRCNNEKPEECRFQNVLDIDMSSCYGSALKAFEYPIGIPTKKTTKRTFLLLFFTKVKNRSKERCPSGLRCRSGTSM